MLKRTYPTLLLPTTNLRAKKNIVATWSEIVSVNFVITRIGILQFCPRLIQAHTLKR